MEEIKEGGKKGRREERRKERRKRRGHWKPGFPTYMTKPLRLGSQEIDYHWEADIKEIIQSLK